MLVTLIFLTTPTDSSAPTFLFVRSNARLDGGLTAVVPFALPRREVQGQAGGELPHPAAGRQVVGVVNWTECLCVQDRLDLVDELTSVHGAGFNPWATPLATPSAKARASEV